MRTSCYTVRRRLDFHTNGMQFQAYGFDGEVLVTRTYFSGGGFILGGRDRPAGNRSRQHRCALPV